MNGTPEAPIPRQRIRHTPGRHSTTENKRIPAPEEHFRTAPAEGSCRITGYTGPGGDVVIPGEIGGLKVVGIGQRVFGDCNELTLRVRGGSCAHRYAIDQAIPIELI